MWFRLSVVPLLFLLCWLPAHAQESVLLKAMRDEMKRAMEDLQLGGMDKPYFVSYSVLESTSVQASAVLGAIASSREGSSRLLAVEVRVGDKDLDNTNFSTRPDFGSALASAAFPSLLPLEDDYHGLRRKIWLATDSAYKQALAHLSKKRAVLQNATRVEEVPDFSEQEPYQYTDDRTVPRPDTQEVETLARDVSMAFDGMPHVFVSEVRTEMQLERLTYVNSEGSSFTRVDPSASIRILAGTQAEDGTALEDSIRAYGRSWDELPDTETLISRAQQLSERLRELRAANYLDRYSGPVLFEGQAAADIVRRVLVPRLLATKAPVVDDPRSSRSAGRGGNPFLDKLGARVLPRFLGVVNDPTLERHDQTPLLGGYPVDDEGVPARETVLVQRGILKTLLATRNPVPGVPASTASRRSAGPGPSNLLIVPDQGLDADELRNELQALVQERDLEFGILVRHIGSPQGRIPSARRGSRGPGGQGLVGPVVAYKIFPDGREELIRQADLVGVTESSFRDIVAASNDTSVYTTTFVGGSNSFSGLTSLRRSSLTSLVVPSLLFEDLTLRRPRGNIPRPPVLPHPLAGP